MSKILIVEDEKSLRILYRRNFELDGHQVITAGDAAEALELFKTESPNLVVLDIQMPGMDGLDAMVRMLHLNPKVPIILNSGYKSYRDNFLSWSADAYVIKSSDTDELRQKVRELLNAQQLHCDPATVSVA